MRATSWTLVLLALAAVSAAGELEVKVTVAEPCGVERKAEPVTGGVPFKKGQVRDASDLALFTSGGQPVAAQFTKLAGYEDGSVQWALLDATVDVPAGGSLGLVVRPGKPTAPGKPLEISEAGDAIKVDTGAATFAVSKAGNMLESIELGGAKVAGPGALELVDAEGEVFKAGRASKAGWEYRGPVRATLRLDGPYVGRGGEWLGYTLRLTFRAGSALVDVRHSLRNSNPGKGFDARIRQATVKLKLGFEAAGQGEGPDWAAGGDGKHGLLLVTRHAGGCYPGGSAYRPSPAKTLFRQSVAGGEAVCFAVPPADTAPAVDRGVLYGYDPAAKVFALADCAHKDTQAWLDFYAGARDAAANGARRKALVGWLHARPDGAWVSETETLGVGRFGTLEDEVATYRKWGWKGADDAGKLPKSPHEPAAYVAKEVIHYESETDSAEGYLLMYLRTGQRGYLDWGRAWAEFGKTHYAYRTDGFAYKGHPRGPRQPSDGLKVSWYGPKEYGWSDGRSEYCHFYARGIFDWYCLSGDVDALEGGRDLVEQVADWDLPRYKPGSAIGTYGCRGFARTWLGPIRLAQLTRDPKDRELAGKLAEAVFKAKDWDERGFVYWGTGAGYEATHQFKETNRPPRLVAYLKEKGLTLDAKGVVAGPGGASWTIRGDGGSWQQATLQMALERYWRLSGDEEARKRAVRMAEFGRDFMWSSKCGQISYRTVVDFPEKGKAYDPGEWDDAHKNCPGAGAKHSGHYTRFWVDVFARAYSMTGEEAWLDWARKAWDRGSKRNYESTNQAAAEDEVYRFAWHVAPKDDTALSTARTFYEVPRAK